MMHNIWKELGANCRNLPKGHTIVRMLLGIVCPAVIFRDEVVMAPARCATGKCGLSRMR